MAKCHMLGSLAVGLAFLWAIDAAEANTLGVLLVQDFEGVAVEDGGDGAGELRREAGSGEQEREESSPDKARIGPVLAGLLNAYEWISTEGFNPVRIWWRREPIDPLTKFLPRSELRSPDRQRLTTGQGGCTRYPCR
jgi:hypothetical protein